MSFPIRSACLFSLLLLGCAHAPKTSPSRGVVVSMTRLTVKPTPENNPGASWDQVRQETNDDEGCGLLVALDLFAPGVGSVASAVCSFSSSSSDGGQNKAEDPDLFVAFELGDATYTSPVIVDRPSHDLRYSLFIPQAALRGDELRVAVYDLDGENRRDSTLIADREFTAAQLDGKIELRGEALGEPSLVVLRLEHDEPPRPQAASHSMSAASRLFALEDLDIPAGMLVEIRATGSYFVGSWNDAKLGPDGYPGGGPREYNLPGTVFGRANHGAAVALLQRDSAAQAVVVGKCVRFVARSGGTLHVGVNDTDYGNNGGKLSFEIRVTTPDADTWARGGTLACDG
jgi:hypothetical protein